MQPRRLTPLPALLALLALPAACAHAPAGSTAAPAPAPPRAGAPAPTRPGGAAEAVTVGAAQPAPATDFRGLLAGAAQRVDLARDDARCVLGPGQAGGIVLQAPVTPATRQWPQADPDASLSGAGAPRVLTRYGTLGESGAGPLLVAITPLPPSAMKRVGWVLSVAPDGQVAEAFTDGRRSAGGYPDVIAASRAVAARAAMQKLAVVVTAASDASLTTLHTLLQGVPHGVPVALAIVLPAGSRIPPAPGAPGQAGGAQPLPDPAACPDGLPARDDGVAQGDLSRQALISALGPLQQAALDCLQGATGVGALGGRVTLAIRIGAGGQVSQACLVSDSIGDPALAACIAESARGVRFAAPAPAGEVDVHLPLHLVPVEPEVLAGACE